MANSSLRIGWIGVHMEGLDALRDVLEAGYDVRAVVTLTSEKAAARSGATDYGGLCAQYGVPLHQVEDVNGDACYELLRDLELDVVFVIGWNQIIKPRVLQLPRLGMIGAHASMLPHNRGSAPINWAIIRGEHETGNSLIWLSEGVDEGWIIDQEPFPITLTDTCATLYEKVAETNRRMILRVLPRLAAGERPGRPQPATDEPLLPRRRPADGLIDWNQPARRVYDFIRALTRPYPGAFSSLDGTTWKIWKAAYLEHGSPGNARPGQVLGPVWSPDESACGQLVACARGALILLELEDEAGTVVRGACLSKLDWKNKTWSN